MEDFIINSQTEEIKTIAPRNITLNLSDADCERISNYAGRAGVTIAQLLQNFIGDLVDGTYSNGSDERDLADRWFQRTWMGDLNQEYDNHLIRWLIDNNCVDRFLDAWDEKEYASNHPAEYDETEDWWSSELEEVFDPVWGWKPTEMTDIGEEIKLCRQYIKDRNNMLEKRRE